MERYLTWPRHVEMQIIGDTHGNMVWVGERDCSAQRRHQKLIEESPAPAFPDEIRQAMGAAAVKVAKAVGYTNAGTVEFLFQDGEFFFLEMNTRLQVEHPVTEMVTGIDLVAEQIRVASGEPLSFEQDDIDRRGHAIEIRINAENPAGGRFLPSPGKITKLNVASGFGTRWDGGYEAGDEVSQYYDNLIGKLVVWGADRATAIARAHPGAGGDDGRGGRHHDPGRPGHPRRHDFAGRRALHEVGGGDARPLRDRGAGQAGAGAPPRTARCRKVEREVDVEVNGKRFAVRVWVPDIAPTVVAGGAPAARKPGAPPRPAAGGGSGSGEVAVPMQGTIVKVLVDGGSDRRGRRGRRACSRP